MSMSAASDEAVQPALFGGTACPSCAVRQHCDLADTLDGCGPPATHSGRLHPTTAKVLSVRDWALARADAWAPMQFPWFLPVSRLGLIAPTHALAFPQLVLAGTVWNGPLTGQGRASRQTVEASGPTRASSFGRWLRHRGSTRLLHVGRIVAV
jgi:hypothetical protein